MVRVYQQIIPFMGPRGAGVLKILKMNLKKEKIKLNLSIKD